MKEFKTGQTAWNSREGKTLITKICIKNTYPINTKEGEFTSKGLDYLSDKHPTLFHSKADMIEYFTNLKEKVTYTRWLNLYEDGGVGNFHSCRVDAGNADIADSRVECREISWTVEI